MITIIAGGFLVFAIFQFLRYGIMLVGALAAMVGCLIALASMVVVYPFAWLLDQWLNARREKNRLIKHPGDMEVTLAKDENLSDFLANIDWQGDVVVNVVDEPKRIEPRVLDLHPNARGVYKLK
jgi:hypothetical protein